MEDSRTRLRDSSAVEKCDESDALEARVHALGIISPPFSRKRNEVGNFSMNFSRNPANEFPLSFFFFCNLKILKMKKNRRNLWEDSRKFVLEY